MSSALLSAFLINALVQIPIIALVGLVAARAIGRMPARQQHRVWLAALMACVVLPLASMIPRPSPGRPGFSPAAGLKPGLRLQSTLRRRRPHETHHQSHERQRPRREGREHEHPRNDHQEG